MEKLDFINRNFRETIGQFLLSELPTEIWYDNHNTLNKQHDKDFSSYSFYSEKDGEISYYAEISFFAKDPTQFRLSIEIEEEMGSTKRIHKIIKLWQPITKLLTFVTGINREFWNFASQIRFDKSNYPLGFMPGATTKEWLNEKLIYQGFYLPLQKEVKIMIIEIEEDKTQAFKIPIAASEIGIKKYFSKKLINLTEKGHCGVCRKILYTSDHSYLYKSSCLCEECYKTVMELDLKVIVALPPKDELIRINPNYYATTTIVAPEKKEPKNTYIIEI